MSKVDIKRLDSVTKNDTTATEQINDNFKALQQAIENTVSRDGTVPNYMDADLDLNSYRIINAGAPVNNKDVVTLEYFEEKAGGAIEAAAEAKASASKAASSAQSALVASNNAIGQLAQAEGLLTAAEVQLENTIQYVDAAKADIDATVEAGKQEINTTIDEASMRLSDTIEQAVEDVKTEAVAAAEGAIQDAADTATQIATNQVNEYTMNTVVPQLNTLVENAEADASNAAESAEIASNKATEATNEADEAKHWAEDSRVWATGEDAEVEEIAPGEEEHSSRGYADLAMAIANTPEDVPVDTSKLLALQIIKGPKGDSSIGNFTGDNTIEGTLNVKSDDNHPIKVTGLAGTSASGFQVVDSNGAGDSDFEHYATGDRYGTRITNHNNTSNTSVSVDLYQSNVGKSVLDATAVDTVLVKDLQVDGVEVATQGWVTTNAVPTGTLTPFAGNTAPDGWLKCDGSAISRTTYAALFAVIGTTYGAGDGSTTFNIPNYTNARFITSATVTVKGTGMTLGVTDGSVNAGLVNIIKDSDRVLGEQGLYGKPVGGASISNSSMSGDKSIGLTTDASKSGITGTASLASACRFIIKY